MSKNTKTAGVATDKTQELPFEEALSRLETVVEAMESDDLPLETLLTRYEEGARLAKVCQSKLAEAELKIQQLEKTVTGELVLRPVAGVTGEDSD